MPERSYLTPYQAKGPWQVLQQIQFFLWRKIHTGRIHLVGQADRRTCALKTPINKRGTSTAKASPQSSCPSATCNCRVLSPKAMYAPGWKMISAVHPVDKSSAHHCAHAPNPPLIRCPTNIVNNELPQKISRTISSEPIFLTNTQFHPLTISYSPLSTPSWQHLTSPPPRSHPRQRYAHPHHPPNTRAYASQTSSTPCSKP